MHKLKRLLWETRILSGEVILSMFCLPSYKGSTLKGTRNVCLPILFFRICVKVLHVIYGKCTKISNTSV